MKVLVLTSILLFPSFSSANCLMRITIDPIYSKNVLASFEKTAKAKKYKIISESDERWEHFRLNISNPSLITNGIAAENIAVKLEKFVTPNFEVAYEKSQGLSTIGRDEMVLNSLKEIPTCPQALYSDIFAKLED
jgi:hypothetical protein